MNETEQSFVIAGVLSFPGTRRKPMQVSLFLEAEDRADALFQAHHGVIESNVAQVYPGAKIQYDLRKMRQQVTLKKTPQPERTV